MKDDRVYLKHILRCIARIEEYTAAGRESFFSSHLIQDGVIRNLQTLAEVWGIPAGQDSPAVLITAYRPDLMKWGETWRRRRT